MKKRVISLLVAVVMIVGMLPLGAITAFAAEEYPIVLDEDKRYEISDKTYTMTWGADRLFEISDGAYVVFTNVTFFNVKGGDGCCVYIDLTDDFSGVEFHNCKFINCESTGNGVVYINNITTPYNDIVFDDCTIENCHADNGYGGFLYVNDGDAQPVFNRTTITNCKAKRGGVEYIQSSNYPSQFNDCVVTDCHASQLGGFVCTNDAEAVVECSNTEISGCSAVDGGAFYMDNGDSFIFENNSRILDCHADEDGGAIYINDVDGEIHGNGVHSGIIINQNTGTAAIISGCSAEYGGGVYISKGKLAEDLVLADNTAIYAGGGMHENSEGDAACTVRNCRFIHNIAGDNDENLRSGGGLYVDDSNGYVIGCKFFENLAYESGADLYSNSNISNCTVVAKGGGGTVSVIVDEEQKQNVTFRSWGSYQFDKGAGTESDPYRIENLEDWDTLFFNAECGLYSEGIYVRLDTDLTVTLSVGLAASDRCFKGHFDGNGHTVTVFRSGNDENVGAFGHAENATIKNLTVKGTITGNSAVGGIVGSAVNTLIENCTSDATIRASEKAGGIIGLQDSGTVVNNCISKSDIRCNNNYAGGVSGYIAGENTVIRNCVFLGYVSATYYHTGGIVGYENAATTVFNAHSFGMVPGAVAGAISGFSAEGSEYELCLYNKEYCTADAHGIGVSPDALYGKATDTVGGKEFRMPDYVNDYINENGKVSDGWLYMVFTESGMPEFVSGDEAIALGADGLLHDYSSYGDVIFLDENTAVLGELAMFNSEPIHKRVYVVNRNIHRTGRIKVYEDVVLIICDGCEYIVDGGIDLENTAVPDISYGDLKYIDREAKLTVTTKSLGNNMGKLTVKATNPGDAAIGGNVGGVDINWEQPSIPNTNGATLNVYGGNIKVNGNCENSVGIGGGAGVKSDFYSSVPEIYCNADGGNGCTINMYNGTLEVTSGKNAVGIGGGNGYYIKRFKSMTYTWDGSNPSQVWNGNGGNGGTFNYHGGTVKVNSDLTAFGRGLNGEGTKTDGSTKINLASGANSTALYSDYPDCNYTVLQTNELAKLSQKPYAAISTETELITELTKHVHKYDTEYVWSDDSSTCTAIGVCPLCAEETDGHIATVVVNTESQYYSPCLRTEYTVYTADFGGLFPTQKKTVQGWYVADHTWTDTGDNEEHHCQSCGITRKHRYRAVSVDVDTCTVTSRCLDCGREITNAKSGDITYIAVEKGAYINTGFQVPNLPTRIAMTVDVQGQNEFWFGGSSTSDVAGPIYIALANKTAGLYAQFFENQFTGELVPPGIHTVELDAGKVKIDGTVMKDFNKDRVAAGVLYLFAHGIEHVDKADPQTHQSQRHYEIIIPNDQNTIHCYGCNIYSDDKLAYYFVPYVNEKGEAGLYNLVEGKFYGNEGDSGKITAYCTVLFDMNGHGTQVEPIDVEYGKTLTRPADPTAKGYNFEGWYKDKDCTEPWDFENEPVTASTGLYAKWTKIVLHPDENGKYHIRNADDWEIFDSMVKDGYTFAGETVLLDGDITVTNLVGGFNSNASLNRPFCGTFDGQNHTITIAFDGTNGSDKGLFSHTSTGAVIKNLTVDGEIKGDWSIGGIVGNASATVFINCTSNVSVTGAYSGNTEHQYAGGIAGYACNGTRFENCVNNGNVAGNKCVGGIAGLSDSGTVFENCVNYGDVTGNENVGGIVGRVSTGKSGNYVSMLLNCIADGTVTGAQYAGGIIGLESGPVSVKNAHFFGTVSSSTDAMGITGSANEGSYYENCFYNKYCPADTHGIGLDIADIPDAANDYIIEHNKTAEAWRYVGFDENKNPVFIDCIHNKGCTVSYEWDGDCCTATLICNNCHIVLHTETLSDLTPIVYDAPDCRTTGYYYYVADFENELFEKQESKRTDTAPGPHIYHDYICIYCPAEDLVTCKSDAVAAIDEAVGDSTDIFLLALANTAKDIIALASDVATVMDTRTRCIENIEKLTGTTHTHTFADTYSHNDTHHWRVCTCENDACKGNITGFAVHTFTVVTNDDGSKTYTCACGYTKTVYEGGSTEGEILENTVKCDGISLTLSSDIYMNFYMQLTDEALKNGKMVFTIGDRIVADVAAKKNETNGRYYFTCPLNALELSETVQAVFTYEGATYTQEYSVEEYVDTILAGNYSPEMKTLVKKISNYGHYAQGYLENIHDNVTIGADGYTATAKFGGEDDISLTDAISALAAYGFTAPEEKNGISFYARSVNFDSATALNFYVQSANGAPTAVCKEGKTVTVKKYKNDIYVVSIKDISATELADDFTVTVDGVDFTGSVLAYCNAVVKAHTGEGADENDALAVNAMVAFYEYYLAAAVYAGAKQ